MVTSRGKISKTANEVKVVVNINKDAQSLQDLAHG